jgi:hypothetical protein
LVQPYLPSANTAHSFDAERRSALNLYTTLLFIHVSSAICLFIGMGLWLFGSAAIGRVGQVEQVRPVVDLMLLVRLVVPASALVVIATGLTMTRIAWGFQTGWIAVALGSLVIIGPIGTWVIDPKVRAIAALAHTLPDGPLPVTLAKRTHDRVLRVTMHMLVAMLFGTVYLMTTKPALTSAIGAMVVSALLGFASGVPFVLARRTAPSDRLQPHEEVHHEH